jgi:hypothetical protein
LEAIERKWEEESKVFTGKQDKMDKLAADKEIETTHDKARTRIEEKIAELKKRGATIEDIAAAEAERAKILVLQNQERERLAREKGDSITADEFHRHDEPSKEHLNNARKRIEDIKAAHIESRERQMNEAGASHEEIKAMKIGLDKRYERTIGSLANKTVEEVEASIKEMKGNLDKILKEKLQNSNQSTDEQRLTVAPANPADDKVPSIAAARTGEQSIERGSSGM